MDRYPQENRKLLDSLCLREPVCQEYLKRIQTYMPGLSIEDVPVVENGKTGFHKIHKTFIYDSLGINYYAV
tara:strand:+ start:481 stop:693 length:213 start_codon:yes stop_codon:yes gene_type:complete